MIHIQSLPKRSVFLAVVLDRTVNVNACFAVERLPTDIESRNQSSKRQGASSVCRVFGKWLSGVLLGGSWVCKEVAQHIVRSKSHGNDHGSVRRWRHSYPAAADCRLKKKLDVLERFGQVTVEEREEDDREEAHPIQIVQRDSSINNKQTNDVTRFGEFLPRWVLFSDWPIPNKCFFVFHVSYMAFKILVIFMSKTIYSLRKITVQAKVFIDEHCVWVCVCVDM